VLLFHILKILVSNLDPGAGYLNWVFLMVCLSLPSQILPVHYLKVGCGHIIPHSFQVVTRVGFLPFDAT
jgi:hypothetical protein